MTQLTRDGRNIEPEFSPDGTRVPAGFAHNPGIGRFGFADIYTMNADGTNIRQVTQTPLWDSEPDWGLNSRPEPKRTSEDCCAPPADLGRPRRLVGPLRSGEGDSDLA